MQYRIDEQCIHYPQDTFYSTTWFTWVCELEFCNYNYVNYFTAKAFLYINFTVLTSIRRFRNVTTKRILMIHDEKYSCWHFEFRCVMHFFLVNYDFYVSAGSFDTQVLIFEISIFHDETCWDIELKIIIGLKLLLTLVNR